MNVDDEDTIPTDGGEMLEEIRRSGLLGPVLTYRWAAATDIGLVRQANEDAWSERVGRIFVVADGMGGHAGGALAARLASDQFADALIAAPDADLDAVLRRINGRVKGKGAEVGADSLGTTLVALIITGSRWAVLVNVGDSRIYRYRDHELVLLSRDQTVRAELVEAGLDPTDFARFGRKLNGLTSYIGGDEDQVRAQIDRVEVRPGDRFLLCSDGVHGQLGEREISQIVARGDCEESVHELLDCARSAGGRDNATALMVQALEESDTPAGNGHP